MRLWKKSKADELLDLIQESEATYRSYKITCSVCKNAYGLDYYANHWCPEKRIIKLIEECDLKNSVL